MKTKTETTQAERKFEKFVDVILAKPEFQGIYEKHKKAALKVAVLEIADYITEEEKASIAAAGN
jgi:hypothetical protein